MKVFKTTVTMTFFTRVDDVVKHWGPQEKDLERDPTLASETPEAIMSNRLLGMKDINEGAWEPHALPPIFEGSAELIDVPDEQIQGVETFYRLDEEGRVESDKRPSDEFIARDIEKLGEEE